MNGRMKLSILDIQMLLQARVHACALCGGAHWELEPDLVGLKLGNPWAPREGRQVECVVLTCHDCGNMHFLSVEALKNAPLREGEGKRGVSLRQSTPPDDEEPPEIDPA